MELLNRSEELQKIAGAPLLPYVACVDTDGASSGKRFQDVAVEPLPGRAICCAPSHVGPLPVDAPDDSKSKPHAHLWQRLINLYNSMRLWFW